MDPGEQSTGTRDEHYDLISVLYHALHGAETCDTYALDAEAGGRRAELYEFFREAQAAQAGLAERAKELLGIGGAAGATPGAGSVPAGAAPPETDLEPQGPPEGELPPEAPPESDVPLEAQPERGTPPDLPPEEDVAPSEEVPPDVPPPHIPAPPPPPDEEQPPRPAP